MVLFYFQNMQHQVTRKQDLLNEKGIINEEGYAKSPVWNYDRSKIKAKWWRIKEWDYYYILNNKFGITLTVADLGYSGFAAVAWMDFENKIVKQKDTLTLLPRGKLNLPSSSAYGDVNYNDKNIKLSFKIENSKRILTANVNSFEGEKLTAKIELTDNHDESMVIATSWKENRQKFYYNQKINCFPAKGFVSIGDNEYKFDPSSSFAGLDWGRGNWTYKNRWYWGSASAIINNTRIGWNLGYGFSDRSSASENMIFYDGKAHKIEEIEFIFDNYMDPWKINSSDGRFEMTFTPILERYSKTNLLIIKSIQHQIFGKYSGYFILDNGDRVDVDNIIGFAEDVVNWW